MSIFFGTTSGTNGLGIQCVADWTHAPRWYSQDSGGQVATIDVARIWKIEDFNTPWWPGGSSMDMGIGNEEWSCDCSRSFELPEVTNGSRTLYAINGITRDVNGSPLSGCTVKLFITAATGNIAADTKIDEETSDANGAYTCYTPYYPDQHYIVVSKASTPHVFGASDNILVGA